MNVAPQSRHARLVPAASCVPPPVAWWARTTIEVMAVGVGVATLPVSLPLLVAVKLLETPARVVADTVTNGTAPLVGPPIARTIDRVLGYAA